jgi:hypothetical protein
MLAVVRGDVLLILTIVPKVTNIKSHVASHWEKCGLNLVTIDSIAVQLQAH